MYICICKAVNERQIHSAAQAGARTVRELCAHTGAGTGCGKCLPDAKRVLDEARCGISPAPARNVGIGSRRAPLPSAIIAGGGARTLP